MFKVAKTIENIVPCYSVVIDTLNMIFGLRLVLKESSLISCQR